MEGKQNNAVSWGCGGGLGSRKPYGSAAVTLYFSAHGLLMRVAPWVSGCGGEPPGDELQEDSNCCAPLEQSWKCRASTEVLSRSSSLISGSPGSVGGTAENG